MNRLATQTMAALMASAAFAVAAEKSAADYPSLEFPANVRIIRQLPDIPIDDASVYFPLDDGHYEYEVFDYSTHTLSRDSENQRLITTNTSAPRWQREANNHITEEWQRGGNGEINMIAKIATEPGYRVELSPSLDIPMRIAPQQQWERESILKAYPLDDPDHLAYTGTLKATLRYTGHYELSTPAGIFSAILLSEEYAAQIGLLDIHSKRYRFYSANIGKVAEIERMSVSAPLFYKSENRLAKVLVNYRGDGKS